jgi:hypothetical protein
VRLLPRYLITLGILPWIRNAFIRREVAGASSDGRFVTAGPRRGVTRAVYPVFAERAWHCM